MTDKKLTILLFLPFAVLLGVIGFSENQRRLANAECDRWEEERKHITHRVVSRKGQHNVRVYTCGGMYFPITYRAYGYRGRGKLLHTITRWDAYIGNYKAPN